MDLTPYSHMRWDNDRQPRQVALLRMAALVPVLLAVLTVSAIRSQDVLGAPLYAGVSSLALATLLSGTAAYSRFDQVTLLAIGALDLVAVVVIGSLPGAAVAGALVVVPGLWLGGIFRWRGVAVVGVVAGIAIVLVGSLSHSGDLGAAVGHVAWITIFALVAAVSMASTINVWVKQVGVLEAQRAELAVALAALEDQQHYTDAIVQSVDVGLAAVGADGHYSVLNPRLAELMALAYPDGHQGRAGQQGEIYAADNRTRLEGAQMPSVRAMNGEMFTETMWIGDEPATRRAIAVSARLMRETDGGFAGAVVSYHDVTTLMTALRVKDDFIALVSHELRTPLTSIIGNLELARELEDDASNQLPRILAAASRNADRLSHLVSDLLTVSQSRDVGRPASPEDVEISDLVTQSVRDVTGRATSGEVGVTIEIEPALRLPGDHSRLQQVTDNLLSNAVKYTRPGGHVWVRLRQGLTNTLLTVQDTGIGVSEADQKELFTKFFRGQNAQHLAIPGVGLGLAISKDIIEDHGGTLHVTSTEGVGTTMTVTLPTGSGSEDASREHRPLQAV